jgi:hypothetical protein
MIVAIHQPIFLPWPGFFHKAVHADRLVLLDDVQFPRGGRHWLARNRLKSEQGELWLTVPVLKKGRGFQSIREVEIHNKRGWRRKHLGSIQQNYVHAPYFADHFPALESIYRKHHKLLVSLNQELIAFLLDGLGIKTRLLLQSELGITGKDTDLLVGICEHLGADRLLALPGTEKYLDEGALGAHGIRIARASFRPPLYPQLWGDFLCNLSALDLLLNCGPRGRQIAAGRGERAG